MRTRIFLLLAVLCAATSCVGELQESFPVIQDGLSLEFSCVERATKGTPLNGSDKENRLQNIYYYLFTEDATGDTPAIYNGSFSPNSTDGTASVNIPLNPKEIEKLFPGTARTCRIFAVANFNPDLGENPTLNQLLNCEVSTAFETVLDPESFIMTSTDSEGNVGTSSIRLISKNNTTAATGDVLLKRLAVKISLTLHVEEDAVIFNTAEIDGAPAERIEIWEPQWQPGANGVGGAQFYLMHGAGSAKLSGEPFRNEGDKDVSVLFDYKAGERSLNGVVRNDVEYISYGYERGEDGKIIFEDGAPKPLQGAVLKKADFLQVEPFYSYPQTWQHGYTYEPYIKLVIPWKRLAGTNPDGSTYGELTKPYYYKVLCAGSSAESKQAVLGGNNWYEIFLNVGILGSETDEAEAVVEGSFSIAQWQKRDTDEEGEEGDSGDNIHKDTEIMAARYLSIPAEHYILYNQDEVSIPITTSHECKLGETVTLEYTDYFSNADMSIDITSSSPWDREGYSLSIDGNHIVFRNPMRNFGVDQTYDVSTFYFTFTIRHFDDPTYERTIKIEQHPAIMITSEANTGANTQGGVFVNGGNGSRADYGGVHGLTGNNKNPNMYIIETTVLTPASGFVIGDPRTKAVDNLDNDEWASAVGIEGGSARELLYYRPASTSTDVNNTIAPKFRIASSYGVTNSLDGLQNATKRCASYQEDGYPAGRWRLPTRDEIMYMAQLTTDKMIPRLLGNETGTSGSDYWCNSGIVTVYGGDSTNAPQYTQTTNDNGFVRCVYDEWYWSVVDKTNGYTVPLASRTTFVWGDEVQ